MPIRFSLNLTLGAILGATIAQGNIHPAIAQYRDRPEDFNPHYYCDGLARDRSERYSQGDGIGNSYLKPNI